MKLNQRDTGPQSDSVRSELQADCLAGVWASNATFPPRLHPGYLWAEDIADGLNAAAAVGDDHIQKSIQGRVNPEKFTHGTSAQRQQWFTSGYNGKHMESCNTFNGPI